MLCAASVPKFGSNVTQVSVKPWDNAKAVQWLAVRNTRGVTSVPLQMMRRLPSAKRGRRNAPTFGCASPSGVASPVCAKAVLLTVSVIARAARHARIFFTVALPKNIGPNIGPSLSVLFLYHPAVAEPKLAEHLRRYPLFSKLADAELMQLAERARMRSYKRGETLFRKDDPGTH